MKLVQKDQNTLIIIDSKLFAYFAGAIFSLIGIVSLVKPDIFSGNIGLTESVISLLVGLFIFCLATKTIVILDKGLGKMIVRHRSLIRKTEKEYGLNDIGRIELQSSIATNGGRKGGSSSIAIVLKSGEQIIFSLPTVSLPFRKIILGSENGVEIAHFLGVPFEERRPLTVRETIGAIQRGIQNAATIEIEKQKEIIQDGKSIS